MAKKKPKVITKKQFDAWSPEKRQAALNDKRTRIRIEDAALPADWLAKRKEARQNRTPITPGSGTTYGDLAKQRAYLEPLTFGEGDRQLADRTANLAAARQRDADWFTAYRQQVADAQQRAIGAQQAAVTGNQQLIQSATDASNASRDSVVKQLQDRAAQLGQSSQAPEYQQLADAATAMRNAQMVNTGQRQIANAATDVASATTGVTTANLKDLEAQGFRNRQEGALGQDKTDYASKKDQWRAKFIDDAIAEARKQVLEDRVFQMNAADKATDNKLAADRLALDSKKARQDARQKRRELALKRQAEARLQQQADKKGSGGGSGGGSKSSGPKPATPKETRTQAAAIRGMIQLIRQMQRAKTDPETGRRYTQSYMRAVLADKDSDVVNTAMDVVFLGGIGKVNRSRWKKAGYDPRDFGQKFYK